MPDQTPTSYVFEVLKSVVPQSRAFEIVEQMMPFFVSLASTEQVMTDERRASLQKTILWHLRRFGIEGRDIG